MSSSTPGQQRGRGTDREGFAKRVGKTIGSGAWTVAVRNRVHHQPVYHLVFFSRSEHGLWLFGEANSLRPGSLAPGVHAPPQPDNCSADADIFEARRDAPQRTVDPRDQNQHRTAPRGARNIHRAGPAHRGNGVRHGPSAQEAHQGRRSRSSTRKARPHARAPVTLRSSSSRHPDHPSTADSIDGSDVAYRPTSGHQALYHQPLESGRPIA